MFGVGWTEILVILVVALLVLGPTKLPDIAKGLGKGIRDFRKAMSGLDDEPEPPRPASWSTPTQAPTQAPPAALPTPPATPPAPPSPNAYSSGWPAPPAPPEAPAETPPTERTESGKTPA